MHNHNHSRRGGAPRPPMGDTFGPDRNLGPNSANFLAHHDSRGGEHPHGGPRGRRDSDDPREGRGAWRGRGRGGPAEAGFGPGFAGPGFGGPEFGPRRGGGRGSRAGRGDIRGAIVMLLSEEPMHGYQLIQEIAKRTGNRWSPSPGAVYPALNMLEDEGLVTITADSGRKLATLTESGTEYVAANAETLGAVWGQATGRAAHPARALRDAVESLAGAAHQLVRSGTEEQAAKAVAILESARRDIYLLLAGETPRSAQEGAPAADDETASPAND